MWQMDMLKWSMHLSIWVLGCMIDSSGGSRGEVLRRIDLARSCMNMLERRICQSSIRLETSYASIRHTLCQFWCMGARLGPPQSTSSLASMHLTHGHYARSWGYRILVMCQMQKSEEPLVVHHFLTWWLIDVCGSSAILLAVHLTRTTIEPLQRVSDKYRPTGSDQQEDLATLGSVQLKQTLALWTLASRLPGERPILETNGDILWTQQRSSGVRSERRIIGSLKSPCTTSYRSLIQSRDHSSKLLSFWENRVFLHFGDRQTDEKTDKQMDSSDALSRSCYRERQLNK